MGYLLQYLTRCVHSLHPFYLFCNVSRHFLCLCHIAQRFLNSAHYTEAGPYQLISDDETDDRMKLPGALKGARVGESYV